MDHLYVQMNFLPSAGICGPNADTHTVIFVQRAMLLASNVTALNGFQLAQYV
jgi:hypothetical protein